MTGHMTEFVRLAEQVGLGDLFDEIQDGYKERTPSGGFHFLYFCSSPKSEKLASNEQREPLIETRGEGGYRLLLRPQPRSLRTTNRGDFSGVDWTPVVTITDEERDAFMHSPGSSTASRCERFVHRKNRRAKTAPVTISTSEQRGMESKASRVEVSFHGQ